ncbi:glycosyltransferase involved in cell wall biosynthesis [Kordia periserrulae]|uniref:Glycosyltransferase involved in cell wall biosynthesis n=1 Tax=Kordia periserrulae TaxID=701523 RepID=A0A2T6BZJ7_9FLAO|nr:glycosyltransferase [Kordia periserrulae]PTX61490.1 glycosyltransferase involved in cell wall biosynthesis [Kordia periserrulae]
MNFLIITHVLHAEKDSAYFAYAPYVKEMNLWLQYVDTVTIVAPLLTDKEIRPIDSAYQHDMIDFKKIPAFNLLSLKSSLQTLLVLPIIFFKIVAAMRKADHIHLRCPGNIGLIGCVAQIFFPKKTKTAKYAGNWDPNSKQPLSYRLQKKILSNTFLTKNMNVLVYGDWKQQTKNIKPFFTATYRDSDKEAVVKRTFKDTIRFSFVGSLSPGKRPLLTIQIIEELIKRNYNVQLDVFGDGVKRQELENYIKQHQLEKHVILHGNVTAETVKEVHKTAHFMMLPSKSEGWPKVVAEAMFWGSLPIVTKISCVPYMLDEGNRGILIEPTVESAVAEIEKVLQSEDLYQEKVKKAVEWSRMYTLDTFETEIKSLL